MFVFIAYALLIWYAALRWRRRIAGIAAVLAGLFVLHLVNLVHGDIALAVGYDPNIFRGLMYPYMGLVAFIGVYLFLFPRELPRGDVHCRVCWFDLSDHEDLSPETACPECGTTIAEAQSIRGRRQARRRRAAQHTSREIKGIAISPEHAPEPGLPANDPDRDPNQQHRNR